jgi:hypothetical protein
MPSRFESASDFFTKPKYPVDVRFREYMEKELNIPRSDEFAKACCDVWSVACKMDGSNLRKMSKDYVGNAILRIAHAYGKLEPVNQFENFEEALEDNTVDGLDKTADKLFDSVINMVKK